MMDRFRFRVWDKTHKKWMDPYENYGLYLNYMMPKNLTKPFFYFESNENCIFQQCTGLKDCEGNIVWEGDIVKCEVLQGNKEGKFDRNDPACHFKTTGEIKWGFGSYYVDADYKEGKFSINFDKKFKIIGNIFEGVKNED